MNEDLIGDDETRYVPATGSYKPRQFILSQDGRTAYERLTDGSWTRLDPLLAAELHKRHERPRPE